MIEGVNRLVAVVVAATATGAGAVAAIIAAAASGPRAAVAAAAGVTVVQLVVAGVAGPSALAEVCWEATSAATAAAPRLPPRVKPGRRSPPECREEPGVDLWLPEEEPDSERFLFPLPSAVGGGGKAS
jgi:hypothetical protein